MDVPEVRSGAVPYKQQRFPAHLFLSSIISIAAVESLIMFALAKMPPMPLWMLLAIDSFALSILAMPFMYFFSFRPHAKVLIEKERLARESRESKAKYETLTAASPDCIKLFDTAGNLVYVNHPHMHKKCIVKDDGRSRHCYEDSIVEEDRAQFDSAVKSALSGKTSVLEIRHVPGFFREVCMEIMAPLKDQEGKIIGVFGVSRDVSEYKRLEKTKETLTQMIVHDLNNPLSAASGNLQLLEMELKESLTEGQRGEFRDALACLDEIKDMAANLLDISLMEESRMVLKKKDFDVYGLVGKISGLMNYLASADRKAITVNLSAHMPQLYADEEVIGRIISNLIRNAIKFTPQESAIEISAGYKEESREFLFGVKDSGAGISRENRERIFDKYVRLDNEATRSKAGKGLGLTFCKMAAESHGGRIWVESEEGKGSIFYFTIPAQQ